MNPEKVGKFIKNLRKQNNLTQKDLAEKYGVTYQAVSKWENGINLPDVSLIREMSKDFNINIEDILDGEYNSKKQDKNKIIRTLSMSVLALVIILLTLLFVIKNVNNDNSFNFKTLSSTCSAFNVTGSIAYDKEKSSIYISQVDYCGGDDEIIYQEIDCNLYEKNGTTNTLINECDKKNNVTLEEFLKDLKLKIDNYSQVCKNYTDDSLYLEINAKDNNNNTTTYKVPLKLNDNCEE